MNFEMVSQALLALPTLIALGALIAVWWYRKRKDEAEGKARAASRSAEAHRTRAEAAEKAKLELLKKREEARDAEAKSILDDPDRRRAAERAAERLRKKLGGR